MVIAHRQELIWQAKDKIQAVAKMRVDVEMGEYKAQNDGLFQRAQVIVSTVQTHTAGGDGGGRIGKFDPKHFGLLIIDEAHHAAAASYRRIIDYYRTNPNLKVLGVTATPDRTDEEALGQLFETVAYDYEMLDAIRDGWLVPIEQQMVNINGLDFSRVKTTAGDLNSADLASVMEQEQPLYGIADATVDCVGVNQKRTLIFCASVKHAEMMANILNRYRNGMAAWVCGKTPTDDRQKILRDFADGTTQVVCNCGVLTEGFDNPAVEVVVMARPTKSRSLYSQMAGRSTRPAESIAHQLNDILDPPGRRQLIADSNKPSCLILDFVGNSGKHKLVTSADILGGKVSDAAVQAVIASARQTGRPVRVADSLDEEEEKIQKAAAEQRRLEAEARRARLTAKADYTKQSVDPFDILQIRPVKPRGWDSKKDLSEPQKNFLRQRGVDPQKLTFTDAKQLIGEIISRQERGLCTFKQARWLVRHGYSPELKFKEASEVMNAWAQNGWRKPVHIHAKTNLPPPPPMREHDNIPEDDNVPF